LPQDSIGKKTEWHIFAGLIPSPGGREEQVAEKIFKSRVTNGNAGPS
jgi:hypothetical protein